MEKHGTKSRRSWRKLPLALDADSGEIIAALTDQDTRNVSQVARLLDQIAPVEAFQQQQCEMNDPAMAR